MRQTERVECPSERVGVRPSWWRLHSLAIPFLRVSSHPGL